MTKPEPKTFRGVTKRIHLSPAQVRLHRWVEKLYREKGVNTPFALEPMMKACGMNYNLRRDYDQAMSFFMGQRKAFASVMEVFFESIRFSNLKASGATDDQIFEELTNVAVTWGLYPVWSDPNGHEYKLFDSQSFLALMNRRAGCAVSELRTKSKVVGRLVSELPSLKPGAEGYPQIVQGGVLVGSGGDVRCEECDRVFNTQREFAEHYATHRR